MGKARRGELVTEGQIAIGVSESLVERLLTSSLPPSHVYVLVHGWAPGWGRTVIENRRLRASEAHDSTGRPFEPWMEELARAIQRANPYADVLSYSWLDDAATSRSMVAKIRLP